MPHWAPKWTRVGSEQAPQLIGGGTYGCDALSAAVATPPEAACAGAETTAALTVRAAAATTVMSRFMMFPYERPVAADVATHQCGTVGGGVDGLRASVSGHLEIRVR